MHLYFVFPLFIGGVKSSSECCKGKYSKPLNPQSILNFIANLTINNATLDQFRRAAENGTGHRKHNEEENVDDVNLNFRNLIKKYGFPYEEHIVTTEDGYILTVQRIPLSGIPVLFLHSLLGSADDYVTPGPDHSLAYEVSRAGYDVWLGNCRGNKYSRNHQNLSATCADFWDFSYYEMGMHDLPAMVEYILSSTGYSRLALIGHSQGCTVAFIMLSERPEYNKNVSLVAALAPITFLGNLTNPLVKTMAANIDILEEMTSEMELYEVFSNDTLCRTLKDALCGDNNPVTKFLCSHFIYALDLAKDLNRKNLNVILSHLPSGTSTKMLKHYLQGVQSTKYRKFDYGMETNLEVYETVEPPGFKMKNIYAPVSLFYSDVDSIANAKDVFTLGRAIKSPIFEEVTGYGHLDFIFGETVRDRVNDAVVALLNLYTGMVIEFSHEKYIY